VIHIAIERKTFCGKGWFSLTLRGMLLHFTIAHWLVEHFGCRECLAKLDDALSTARPIR
jgi:hypothetical protein